jgi:hypothetical protein
MTPGVITASDLRLLQWMWHTFKGRLQYREVTAWKRDRAASLVDAMERGQPAFSEQEDEATRNLPESGAQ